MITIHKYLFKISDEVSLILPERRIPLDIQLQDGKPCLWATVDTGYPNKVLKLKIYGTGHPILSDDLKRMTHLKTLQMGAFVWHIFQVNE